MVRGNNLKAKRSARTAASIVQRFTPLNIPSNYSVCNYRLHINISYSISSWKKHPVCNRLFIEGLVNRVRLILWSRWSQQVCLILNGNFILKAFWSGRKGNKSLSSCIWYDLCFFRYFRTNNPMEGRTMSRTNLAKNGFSEALYHTLQHVV